MNPEPTQTGLFNIPWEIIWDAFQKVLFGIGTVFIISFRWLRRWFRRFRALEKAVLKIPESYVQYPTLERREEALEVRLAGLVQEGREREDRIISAIKESKAEIKQDVNTLTLRVDRLYGSTANGQR